MEDKAINLIDKRGFRGDGSLRDPTGSAQMQAFLTVFNDVENSKSNPRTTLGQLRQDTVDLKREEERLVLQRIDQALRDETAAKSALAAPTPASTLPTRPMVRDLKANA